jgi:hypothetical protein
VKIVALAGNIYPDDRCVGKDRFAGRQALNGASGVTSGAGEHHDRQQNDSAISKYHLILHLTLKPACGAVAQKATHQALKPETLIIRRSSLSSYRARSRSPDTLH